MVALDLDDAVFGCTPRPAASFQVASQGFQLITMKGNPGDDRDGLPTPPLGLPPDPDDAVTGRDRRFVPAGASLHRPPTGGADPAQFGGVDE